MSRRVPRTLRTLKLDYREIAALLPASPFFSLSAPACSPSSFAQPTSSSSSSNHLLSCISLPVFSFGLLRPPPHPPSLRRSQSPSSRSHRLHRHWRQNLPGGLFYLCCQLRRRSRFSFFLFRQNPSPFAYFSLFTLVGFLFLFFFLFSFVGVLFLQIASFSLFNFIFDFGFLSLYSRIFLVPSAWFCLSWFTSSRSTFWVCFVGSFVYLLVPRLAIARTRKHACDGCVEPCVSVSPTQLTACRMERDDTARHF